ncbi:FAD-dependent oxidoreductase [Luteolibacter flavescens]|uniref:FAD-dependent oxidoreductase n=1 Tax=Luteolibacter flavescens TaxID=1859460 RepID=A0ABT3FR71_9BACT|nr:FAD-dependent oxidoreductase [Luteolibacter flavescens]MCW1886055.1 FAD-dependent oxidoreductase [Luteolibacter flavescens]
MAGDTDAREMEVELQNLPLWLDLPDGPAFPTLAEDTETGVLVIGGGITGVTAAWLLAREGRRVTLLERETIGARDSGHTTAHLTYLTDTRLPKLVDTLGKDDARLAWEAGRDAMAMIRSAVESLGIGCGFAVVPGYLALDDEEDQSMGGIALRREEELMLELGFDVVMDGVNPVTGTAAIRFREQMKFHPLKYLRALAADAVKHGAKIHEHTSVDEFHDDPKRVIAGGHEVRYDKVIIATHVPLQGTAQTMGAALFQSKLFPYSSYAVCVRIPADGVKELIWSDTAEPFRYVRMEAGEGGEAQVILGGEDHKTGQESDPDECFARLEEWLTKWIPDAEVTHRWSGQVIETVDGLPYIGETVQDQFVATGFSGNGFTYGTAAAMMALAWVRGEEHAWSKLFAPGRKTPLSLKEYLKENADATLRMIRDWLKTPDGHPQLLEPDEGRVMEHNGERVAAYRDPEGELHLCSAVCPHLGCVVAWNAAERTWDCPCHGSRFGATGKVIAGPAEKDLKDLTGVAL